MQQSQKKMQQAAQDIVKAGLRPEDNSQARQGASAEPVSEAGTAANDLPGNASVEATTRTSELSRGPGSTQDIVEPLIEQQVQQHLFNASASVVQVASENLGTLIDDLS